MATVREAAGNELTTVVSKVQTAINELNDEQPDVWKVIKDLDGAEDILADVLGELRQVSREALETAVNGESDRL